MPTNHHLDTPLREQLKAGLLRAMKDRQSHVVRALRSVLSEIDNAEAVELNASMVPVVGRANDVPRKILSEVQMLAILQSEYGQISESFKEYTRLEKHEEAAQLREELDALEKYLKASGQ